jgi:hypothetical protein
MQKIKHILLNNPLPEAISYFKSQIKHAHDSSLTHSVLIIKRENKPIHGHKFVAQKSIDQFIDTTEKTEKLLTPNFMINIKKGIKGIKNKLKNLFSRKAKHKPGPAATVQQKKQRPSLLVMIKAIPLFFLSMIKNFFMIITGRKKVSAKQIKNSVKKQPKQLGTKLTKMHHFSKLIIIGIIILIGVLAFSISWAKKQSQIKKAQEQYTQQVEKVQGLINEAEVSFIYRNKNKSLGMIQNAEKELSYLPQATEAQQANYQELQDKLEEIKNKLFNIEKVIPKLLVQLQINGQPVNSSKLLLAADKLYAFGQVNSAIEITPAEKKISQIIDSEQSLTMAANDEAQSYFLARNNKLFQLSENQFSEMTITFEQTPTALQVYNSNLYALNKSKQQIVKYSPITATSFSAPISWITELNNANLTTATSLTIDGSIYVLNNNGAINKFHAGAFESFKNPTIQPVVTSATKVITAPDINFLYIFEPKTKRLIVLNKSGALVKQLLFESLQQTTDIEISADGKTGYVLSGDKVYEFGL